jgi:hypothetical protein
MNYEYSYPYSYPYPYKQKSNHHSIIKFVVCGILLTGLIIGGIIFAIKTTKKSPSGNKSYCLSETSRTYNCSETSNSNKNLCIQDYSNKNWFDGKNAKSNCVAYCKLTFGTACNES